MSPEARERSFDELATELANGSLSRGKALKLMGAALVGGALASIPGIAEAAPPLKRSGKRCRSNGQCLSGLCVSGVCSGAFKCGRCGKDCACVALDDGSIACVFCPGGSCFARGVTSCNDCAQPNVCYRPFGTIIACAPPCPT